MTGPLEWVVLLGISDATAVPIAVYRLPQKIARTSRFDLQPLAEGVALRVLRGFKSGLLPIPSASILPHPNFLVEIARRVRQRKGAIYDYLFYRHLRNLT